MTDYLGKRILDAAYLDRKSQTLVVRLDDVSRAFADAARLGFLTTKPNETGGVLYCLTGEER